MTEKNQSLAIERKQANGFEESDGEEKVGCTGEPMECQIMLLSLFLWP